MPDASDWTADFVEKAVAFAAERCAAEIAALKAERDRLRIMLDQALYSIAHDDYETQKSVASDLKEALCRPADAALR